ncbi:hypothetical protein Tco_0502398 [Tanacetum coccineum]
MRLLAEAFAQRVFFYPLMYDQREGDELGSNGGSSNSVKKVVQDVAGSASGSPSNTPLVAKISELKSQMIEGKLVLLGDDGKLLKPCNPTPHSSFNVVSEKVNDLVNEDSDSKVEEVNEARCAKDTLGIVSDEEAPSSPDYVPGPEAPPSPDYVPGPKEPE